MNMSCPACQADVPLNSMFCPKCGERLDGAPPRIGAKIAAESAGPAGSPAERFKDKMGAPPVGDNASDQEEMLWEGGYSPKAMFLWWISAAIATLALIVGIVFTLAIPVVPLVLGGLIVLAWLWPASALVYRRLGIGYKLTSQRFIHERGILSRTTDRIEVIDIDDVGFRQSLVDRMVGVGTIIIESGDRTHPELKLIGIDDVKRVYDLIDSARRQERVRRGIHIASAGKGSGL
jgi:membrane protein YdbS with pleckstrin-like domain